MTDSHAPDPNFPDRPDHPDFWRMAKIVTEQDANADRGDTVAKILADRGIDSPESLAYLAGQRALRAVGHNFTSHASKMFLVSFYMDAFANGAAFAQDKLVTYTYHNDDTGKSTDYVMNEAAASEVNSIGSHLLHALDDLRAGKGDPLATIAALADTLIEIAGPV